MQIPLEISYRDVPKTDFIDNLIREKADKLDQVCGHLISCRVAVEKTQEHQRTGNPHRIRLDLRVPPNHEIVIRRETTDGDLHEGLPGVIREAFNAARRQLKELSERQRGEIKSHPTNDSNGVVDKVFALDGYGFIKSVDGREIYFHANSVTGDDFDRLKVGTAVRYIETSGDDGPQASTVQITDVKPGSRIV